MSCTDSLSDYIVGPPGPTGDPGLKGGTGPTGYTGRTGPTGLKGGTGATGLKGGTGPTGSLGPEGYDGLKGETGTTGLLGPEGFIGFIGITGPTGYKGEVGFIGGGSTGDTGPAGSSCSIQSGTATVSVCDNDVASIISTNGLIVETSTGAVSGPPTTRENRMNFYPPLGSIAAGGVLLQVNNNRLYSNCFGYEQYIDPVSYSSVDGGYGNVLSAFNAHIEGKFNNSSGDPPIHTEGSNNICSGGPFHCEGTNNNFTSSQSSHYEGSDNVCNPGLRGHTQNMNHINGTSPGLMNDAHIGGYQTTINENSADPGFVHGYKLNRCILGQSMIGKYTSGINTSGVTGSTGVGVTGRISGFSALLIGGGTGPSSVSIPSVVIGTRIFGSGCKGGGVADFWAIGGPDYAEYFEWDDGNSLQEDRCGYFVGIVTDKINIASDNKKVIGITSDISGIIGDSAEMYWNGMIKRDHLMRPLTMTFEETPVGVLSEQYDPSVGYTPRSQRKEWIKVGLMGKIPVYDDGTCVPGEKCDCINGIATKGSKWHVMKRLSSFPSTVLILFVSS